MKYLGRVRKAPELNIISCSNIYKIASIRGWKRKDKAANLLFSDSWWEQFKRFWRKNGI